MIWNYKFFWRGEQSGYADVEIMLAEKSNSRKHLHEVIWTLSAATHLIIWFVIWGEKFPLWPRHISLFRTLQISDRQSAIACSKLTIETLEQGVKYGQS